jgi:opacity protein-like surface antigen
MLKTLLALTLATGTCIAHAQARPTASRLAEAQVGGTYVNGQSDYARSRFNGFGIYADLDFRMGLGAEAAFHYISDGDPKGIYERTYEIGARYSRHYGRFQPYAKFLVGRGVFNFYGDQANLAYNLYAMGGGTDYRVLKNVNVRVEYEAQKWMSGPLLDNGLSPNLVSVGAAYHFK